MPVRSKPSVRCGILICAALSGGVAAPCAAASRDGSAQRLLIIVSSPALLAPARIGALYGVVTSGFRTVEHNRAVGGVPNSYHLLGRALDVQRRPGVTHAMIDAAMRRAGFALVESLDEGDHSHFAFAGFGRAAPVVTRTAPEPAPTAPVPAKPAPPPVLADNHGTLLIDVAAPAASGGTSNVP